MPCTKCNSDFNLLNWKIKCGECEDKYCNRCLKKLEGVLYCEKCIILLKRPPDRRKLMELKPKDLQDYLKKHNISTHGLVEKQELVELFCNKHIPVRQRKGAEKLSANFGFSLLRETPLSDLLDTLESDSLWNNSSDRRGNHETNSQEQGGAPRPPPRRRSPRNSPTSATSASSHTQQQASFNVQSDNVSSPLHTERPNPPSTSFDNTGLGSEWVYVNSEGSTEDVSQRKTPDSSPVPPKCPKLQDLKTLEDLNQLTAKQLKILLTLNRVDYKGCVEKKELLDKAAALWKDEKKLREGCTEELDDLCKLCMDAPLDCVLLECGHIATCIECGKKLAECPICRQYVSRVVRTFKA